MTTTTVSSRLPRLARIGVIAGAVALSLAACSPGADDGPDASPDGVAVEQSAVPAFDGAHVDATAFAAAAAAPGVTIVDVRTPEEFAGGHLPGAVNINLQDAGFAEAIGALDPEQDYAVYCRSGNRSRGAIEVMTDAGIESTVGLEGGIGAWTGEVVTG